MYETYCRDRSRPWLVRVCILNSTDSDKEQGDTVRCRKENIPSRGMKNCLFVAIVATEVVASTISVRKRTGGVLPSVVPVLGIVN